MAVFLVCHFCKGFELELRFVQDGDRARCACETCATGRPHGALSADLAVAVANPGAAARGFDLVWRPLSVAIVCDREPRDDDVPLMNLHPMPEA